MPKVSVADMIVCDMRGVALMMVLWVLVLLSIISMSFLASTRWGSASVRNFKEDT